MTRAIIQGEEGSNSSVAARQLLGTEVELVCCTSFAEAFAALDRGDAPLAVLPFENSTAGRVPDVAAQLVAGPLFVTAETSVSIRFVAAARVGAERIERILTHPMAAAQCRRFLESTGWQVVDAHDTAGAARLVSESANLTTAALCPLAAATRYGLQVVNPHCGDDPKAVTRFFRVQLTPPSAAPEHRHSIFVMPEGRLVELAFGATDPRCAEFLGSSARLIGSY